MGVLYASRESGNRRAYFPGGVNLPIVSTVYLPCTLRYGGIGESEIQNEIGLKGVIHKSTRGNIKGRSPPGILCFAKYQTLEETARTSK